MAGIWTDLIKLGKKQRMRKILGFAQTNLALLHSYLQGWSRTKKSPRQPKQSSIMQRAQQVCRCPCCDLTGASKLTHSLKKWISMIKENYLCFTLICLVNSHENLENSPCCFPKCLCLRPKLSYSFNPVQEMQDQSWWDFISSQLFPAPSLEFRQLLVFIPQPWASQIWHFSVNPWFWHEFWTGVLSPENSPALQQMTHLHCGTPWE